MPVLSARGVSKAYGPQLLFDDVSITVRSGERVGLLGANGAGKSTLLRILAGLETADTGVIDRRRGASMLYLAQEPELTAGATAREIVEEGLSSWKAATTRHAEVTRAIEAGDGELVHEQAELAEQIDHLGGWEQRHRAEQMLEKLGIADPDRIVDTMSGGERRRVALARVLVAQPALAILDEPTNHLDADTIEWLEEYLVQSFRGAVLVVTHDRYVLDAIADRIIELDRSKLVEFEGDYTDYLEKKAEMIAQEERVEANRQNLIRREQAWLRRGAQARSTKQKARIQRAEAVIAIDAPEARVAMKIEAGAVRTGRTILELHKAGASIDARVLFENLTLHMVSGDRIGIIGPNGTGKTTLLKLISGELAPASGSVVLGAQTKIAYFDQARAQLIDEWSVFDNVAEREGAERTGGGQVRIGGGTIDLRTYLEQFMFEPSKQRQKVGALSGGERARVALAKMLKTGANMLLLDEPTNDLDVPTLRALENWIGSWPGCSLIVSHDRYFLNCVATAILAFEPNERGSVDVTLYPGNYDMYRALKAEAEGQKAAAMAPPPVPRANVVEKSAIAALGLKPLTFTERLELDKIFETVSAAEEEVQRLETALASPTLYTERASEGPALIAELDRARATVAKITARWEELEARREAKRS